MVSQGYLVFKAEKYFRIYIEGAHPSNFGERIADELAYTCKEVTNAWYSQIKKFASHQSTVATQRYFQDIIKLPELIAEFPKYLNAVTRGNPRRDCYVDWMYLIDLDASKFIVYKRQEQVFESDLHNISNNWLDSILQKNDDTIALKMTICKLRLTNLHLIEKNIRFELKQLLDQKLAKHQKPQHCAVRPLQVRTQSVRPSIIDCYGDESERFESTPPKKHKISQKIYPPKTESEESECYESTPPRKLLHKKE